MNYERKWCEKCGDMRMHEDEKCMLHEECHMCGHVFEGGEGRYRRKIGVFCEECFANQPEVLPREGFEL